MLSTKLVFVTEFRLRVLEPSMDTVGWTRRTNNYKFLDAVVPSAVLPQALSSSFLH
jgi:hypothetical protein